MSKESKSRQERMKDLNSRNKDKERMRDREKEAREREARYSNGHLFTSLTVSAMTLCSSCNRSITAKEALSCPTCNVTIHNRCRDSLASCTKMKQKQQKLALVRNSSALQNVTLRSKAPMTKERPSSAIYPSDSLRQSLLGSRRGRSGLLAKSVSTNNIAGCEDSPVGLRRILSQSTESLNFRSRTMSLESLNDDGEPYYAPLLTELQEEGGCVSADSWSLAVDSNFLQSQRKDTIKRQDVIYELIQTEFHHVRTLRIMEGVYRRGMQEEVLLEAGQLHAVFPCLDQLLQLHTGLLGALLSRRQQGLVPGSQSNFTITRLGEVLIKQFSGQPAEDFRKLYSEFCCRHPKAVKLYKELLTRDKRFQHFIRRVSRGPLLRRHGVQECILLVTQRITKYPVLVQRILDNTKGDEEEAQALSTALLLLKELLSSVDQEVLDLQRSQRLQEVRSRLDPRAQTELRGGGVFGGGELLRRRLVHDGTLLWKTQSSRMKDVQMLLMSDILVFLQEKDQKFIFPALEKPPVVSLTRLIVRDIANQERGMFLISDSAPPEMYELYASSKDDRKQWMKLIQQTVLSCPSREEFPLIETEDKALVRRLRADIQQKDREVLELLQERVTLFSDLVEVTSGSDALGSASSRKLFRLNSSHAPQAEKLLTEAISEVDRLSELLLSSSMEPSQTSTSSVPNGVQDHKGAPRNGDSVNCSLEDSNGNQLQEGGMNTEICHRLLSLSTQLQALQAAVICQDSVLELRLQTSPPTSPSLPAPTSPAASGGDAVRLLQEEVARLRPLEAQLADCERSRAQLEQRLREEVQKGCRSSRSSRGRSGDAGDVIAVDKLATRRRSCSDVEPRPLAPLDQLDCVCDVGQEEKEGDVIRISPRSDSPRDLQDIPEESECGAETTST